MTDRRVARVRHEMRSCLLEIQDAALVTPKLIRLPLGRADLRRF